jgi:hypothetical protein
MFTGNSRTIKKEQFRYCELSGGQLLLFQKLIGKDGNLKTSNILNTVLKEVSNDLMKATCQIQYQSTSSFLF